MSEKYDKVDRVYLLDGSDHFNPFATYLISYLRSDSIERVQFHSPRSSSSTKSFAFPYTTNLNIATIWKSDTENENIHTMGILSENVLIFKNRNGKFQYLPVTPSKDNITKNLIRKEASSRDSLNQDSLNQDSSKQAISNQDTLKESLLLHNKLAITATGERGFVVDNGKVFTFKIRENNPETPSYLEKIPKNVVSIHINGNNKLLYIHDGRLSVAEFSSDTVSHTFDFTMKGKDKLENSVIEYIQLNPADPSIAAVIAKGTTDTHEVYYLCIGHLNFSRRTITLNTIRPQSFNEKKIILSCNWSPDGQKLAVLTSIYLKVQNDGCGQLIIIPFDVLNQKTSRPRSFKPYDQFVKISSGILWSSDGSYLFYVEKDEKGEYLAFVDNKMKKYHFWKLSDEDKKPFSTITGIAGPVRISKGDTSSMLLYISGTVGKSSVVCKTVDALPLIKPEPLETQLPTEIFNNCLSSTDEIIEFEEILKKKKIPSKAGSVNVLENLKDINVPLKSDMLKRAFKHYCWNIIDKVSPKYIRYDYKQMTLTDLKASQKAEEDFIHFQEKEIDTFIASRKSYIKEIIRFEREIENLKAEPAASCVLIDSIINTITVDAVEFIREKRDLSPIFLKVSTVKKNLDELYPRYALYDEYRNLYKNSKNDIEQIILSTSNLNSNAINYLTYLSAWDSTLTEMNRAVQRSMFNYVKPHREETETDRDTALTGTVADTVLSIARGIDTGTVTDTLTDSVAAAVPANVNSLRLNTILQEYVAFGHPKYLRQVNKSFRKNGTKGVNQYFTLNRKILLISAGSGAFFTGLGIICNLAGKNDLQRYNDEKSSANDLSRYKEKTKREYAFGYVFYSMGTVGIGFSTYYFLNHIFKKRRTRTDIAYDPETSTFVWSF